MNKVCGNCKHWERAADYQWGHCMAPLPIFILNNEEIDIRYMTYPNDTQAKDCDLYEEKNNVAGV